MSMTEEEAWEKLVEDATGNITLYLTARDLQMLGSRFIEIYEEVSGMPDAKILESVGVASHDPNLLNLAKGSLMHRTMKTAYEEAIRDYADENCSEFSEEVEDDE